MNWPLPPKEVYCWRGRIYSGKGPLKCSMTYNRTWRPRLQGPVYVAVITDRLKDWPEGWVDVTSEFITEDGQKTW